MLEAEVGLQVSDRRRQPVHAVFFGFGREQHDPVWASLPAAVQAIRRRSHDGLDVARLTNDQPSPAAFDA